jgi:hypothetical protein
MSKVTLTGFTASVSLNSTNNKHFTITDEAQGKSNARVIPAIC